MPRHAHHTLARAVLVGLLATALIACTAAPGEGVGSPSPSTGGSPGPSAAVSPGAGSPGASPSSGTGASPSPGFSVVEPSPVASTNVPQDILDAVLADASERTGTSVEDLVITKAELVTWPDGGLGCPEPGMVYIQVLVDGYQVIVADGVNQLDYRGDGDGFRICPT